MDTVSLLRPHASSQEYYLLHVAASLAAETDVEALGPAQRRLGEAQSPPFRTERAARDLCLRRGHAEILAVLHIAGSL